MECPQCRYMMSPFEKECPKCARLAKTAAASPPPATAPAVVPPPSKPVSIFAVYRMIRFAISLGILITLIALYFFMRGADEEHQKQKAALMAQEQEMLLRQSQKNQANQNPASSINTTGGVGSR